MSDLVFDLYSVRRPFDYGWRETKLTWTCPYHPLTPLSSSLTRNRSRVGSPWFLENHRKFIPSFFPSRSLLNWNSFVSPTVTLILLFRFSFYHFFEERRTYSIKPIVTLKTRLTCLCCDVYPPLHPTPWLQLLISNLSRGMFPDNFVLYVKFQNCLGSLINSFVSALTPGRSLLYGTGVLHLGGPGWLPGVPSCVWILQSRRLEKERFSSASWSVFTSNSDFMSNGY